MGAGQGRHAELCDVMIRLHPPGGSSEASGEKCDGWISDYRFVELYSRCSKVIVSTLVMKTWGDGRPRQHPDEAEYGQAAWWMTGAAW